MFHFWSSNSAQPSSRSYILQNCDRFHYHVFTCMEQQAHMFNVWGPRHRLYDRTRITHCWGNYTPIPIVRIQWFPRNLLYLDLLAALHSRPRLRLYWPMGFTRHTREHPCSPSQHCIYLSMKITFLYKCACHIRQTIYAWAVWRGMPTPPSLYCFGNTYAHN